jgi:hypothetical protein
MHRTVLGFAFGFVLAVTAMLILGASAPRAVPKPGDVITGRDLGFRVVRVGSDYVEGTIVVRVNDEWTEAERPSLPDVVPAKP